MFRALQEKGLKFNESELARRLGKDRRTIHKYINGYVPKTTRNRKSQFDDYYDIISELLNDNFKVFAYKRVLWQYMKDNYDMKGALSSFRRYISSVKEFEEYFRRNMCKDISIK